MLRRLIVPALVLAGAGYAAYRLAIRPWWQAWGVVPEDVTRALPGDELIPDATTSETRGIDIDAPPERIWPWLVQMGYGRAGWYSYDQVDMAGSSARRIVPELQQLAVGDVMPTHPGGGFQVKVLESPRALVLYADNELMGAQAQAETDEKASANVAATGAFMVAAQPDEFKASWAFVLEPRPGGGTRLMERVRTKFGDAGDKPWTRYTLPVMGFGVFVMVRRQLLGIKTRAERESEAEPVPSPAS